MIPPRQLTPRFLAVALALATSPLFAAQPTDLLENGNFTTDLTGWTLENGTWVQTGAMGPFLSVGTAEVTSTGATTSSMSQCVDLTGVPDFRSITLAVYGRTTNHTSRIRGELELYSGAECTTFLSATSDTTSAPELMLDTWVSTYHPTEVPAAATSALVRVAVDNTAGGQVTRFDTISLRLDLVFNGHFTSNLVPWTQNSGSWSHVIEGHSSPMGAAQATIDGTGNALLSECLNFADLPTTDLVFPFVRVRALDTLDEFFMLTRFFDGPTCGGSVISEPAIAYTVQSLNTWEIFGFFVGRPVGAQSVAYFAGTAAGTPGSRFQFDDFIMTLSDGLFSDGFESGDTTAWSSQVP